MNFQSNYNSLLMKMSEIDLQKEITRVEKIKSNEILIESDLTET